MNAGVIGIVIGLLLGGFAGFVFGWNVGWDDHYQDINRMIEEVDALGRELQGLMQTENGKE